MAQMLDPHATTRRTWLATVASAALLSLSVGARGAAPNPTTEVPWRADPDIEAALQEAAMEGKRVMVYVTATWCEPCKRLQQEVFDDPGYGPSLSRSFVPIKVDSDTDTGRTIRERYEVKRLPTVFVLRPSGESAGRIEGYAGAERFKKALDRLRGDDDGGGDPLAPTF